MTANTLEFSINNISDLINAKYGVLLLSYDIDYLIVKAISGWTNQNLLNICIKKSGSLAGYTLLKKEILIFNDYSINLPFEKKGFINIDHIESSISAPIIHNNNEIGVLIYYSDLKNSFTADHVNILQEKINYLIPNLQCHICLHFNRQKQIYLKALQKANIAIREACLKSTFQGLLEKILEQAINCSRDINTQNYEFGTIHLFNQSENKLILKSVFPIDIQEQLGVQLPQERVLDSKINRIGVTGRAIQQKSMQFYLGKYDPDYIEFNNDTQFEIAIPLFDYSGKPIAVFNIESNNQITPSNEYLNILTIFSEMAAIAIEIMKYHFELAEIRENFEIQNALALSSFHFLMIRHKNYSLASSMEENLKNIKSTIDIVHSTAGENIIFDNYQSSFDSLNSIINNLKFQSFQPLSQNFESIDLKIFFKLIIEKYKSKRGRRFECNNLIEPTGSIIIFSNYQWLEFVVTTVIDNAIDSMANKPVEKIEISICMMDSIVKIQISDFGNGINEITKNNLFNKTISTKKEQGLGIGLLISKYIIRTLKGDIFLTSTSNSGSTFSILVPRK